MCQCVCVCIHAYPIANECVLAYVKGTQNGNMWAYVYEVIEQPFAATINKTTPVVYIKLIFKVRDSSDVFGGVRPSITIFEQCHLCIKYCVCLTLLDKDAQKYAFYFPLIEDDILTQTTHTLNTCRLKCSCHKFKGPTSSQHVSNTHTHHTDLL